MSGSTSEPGKPTRRGYALLALVLGVVAASGILGSRKPATVHLMNGLDEPVEVELEGRSVKVGSRSWASLETPVGTYRVEVRTAGGDPLETGLLSVDRRNDFTAWNVAGAAPVVLTTLAPGTEEGRHPAGVFQQFCGTRAVTIPHVRHLFEPPAPGHGDDWIEKRRTPEPYVDVLDLGWLHCVTLMLANGLSPDELIETALDPTDELQVVNVFSAFARAVDADSAWVWVGPYLARHPHSVLIHRVHQRHLKEEGRLEEAVAYYEQYSQAFPDRSEAAFLQQLLVSRELRDYSTAVQKFPYDPYLLSGFADQLLLERRFDESAEYWSRASDADQRRLERDAVEHATALVGAGRVEDAWVRINRVPLKNLKEMRAAGLIAQLLGETVEGLEFPPDHPMVEALYRAWVHQEATTEGLEPQQARVIVVTASIGSDSSSAIAVANELPDGTLSTIDPTTGMLLLGEAVRAGDDGLVSRLAEHGPLAERYLDVQQFIVSGRPAKALDSHGLQFRAAMALARSRVPGVSPERVEALRKSAHSDDVLRGVVSRMLNAIEESEEAAGGNGSR